MSDLIPFWIREMQTRIESDWNKIHEDQHRARMRKITATLSPDALHELWGSMGLDAPETVEAVTFGEPGMVTAEFVRAQAELARLEAEKARSAVLPPAAFTKIGEPKKLYKAITITEWKEVDE